MTTSQEMPQSARVHGAREGTGWTSGSIGLVSDRLGGEAADDGAVGEVHEHGDDWRLPTVVAQHEAG